MKKGKSPLNLDRHRRQTQSRLIAGGAMILLLVGGGLVWALYGRAAAITALSCLLAGCGLFVLLWLLLSLLETWVKEDEP